MNDTQRELFERKTDKWLEEHIYEGDGGIRFYQYVEAYIDSKNAGRVSDSAFEIVERAMWMPENFGRSLWKKSQN